MSTSVIKNSDLENERQIGIPSKIASDEFARQLLFCCDGDTAIEVMIQDQMTEQILFTVFAMQWHSSKKF